MRSSKKKHCSQAKLTHFFSANNVGEPTEKELAHESTDGSCDFDSEILICVQRAGGGSTAVAIDISQHRGGEVDSENVISK